METTQYKTVNRQATFQPAASLKTLQRKAVAARSCGLIQTATKISSPNDPEEKEADSTAKKVMRMALPESAVAYVRTQTGGVFRVVKGEEKETTLLRKLQSPYIRRFADSGIFTRQVKEEAELQRAEADSREEEQLQRRAAGDVEKEEPVQRQAEADTKEEEQLQRQAAGDVEKEKPVQRQAEADTKEEEQLQRRAAGDVEKEEPLQRQAGTDTREEEKLQRRVEGDVEKEKPIQRQAGVDTREEEPLQRRTAGDVEKEETIQRQAGAGPDEKETIQAKLEGQPNVASNVAADIQSSMSGGTPLPLSVRRFMEPRFSADFSKVKIHSDAKSARLNKQVNAQAFTLGNQIFFGKDRFQPDSPEGKELIAHELTHTVQQGAAIQRREDVSVTHHSPPKVQRLGIGDALDYFADKANLIPGFRMFTIILGVNPINMSRVERSAANILRALIEFIPGGALITQALDNHGVFDKVGNWVEEQIRTLGMTGSAIKRAVMDFLDSLSWRDIFDLGGVWSRAKRIFTDPIDRIISFAKGLVTGIIEFIKDAILRPLASLAEGTRGYDLLKAVLGEDPITGDPVPRNADTLIGGFMTLIGRQDVWNNLKASKAVPRAWAWFQGAMASLMGFVRQIPTLFVKAFKSLELVDIVLVPRAFAKVAAVFGGFIGQFMSWAGNAVWSLLEIIFAVVAPGAIPYLKKAGGAFRSILQNPIGFVGNLVRAGKLGFQQFATNIGEHLKTSLIQWLTGTLGPAGVYIPQSFSIREIIKFVLSVLGLTWQNIRVKLVRVIGETAVKAMETGFDIVVTLVKEGPAAAWEKIKEQLTNLKEMVIEQIMSFVTSKIVQSAVAKLVTMLNPAGAIIQAIIAIYNTIMFFIERMRQIIQVAMAFINSISAIASGVIGAAANRVEQTMAGLLTLAISFLARFAGLGKVSDAVINIINKIREPIDKALDRIVDWIVSMARKLGRFIAQAGVPQDPNERLRLAAQAAVTAAQRMTGRVTSALLQPALGAIKLRYGLQEIVPYERGGHWWVRATINPSIERNLGIISAIAEGTPAAEPSTLTPMQPQVQVTFRCNTAKYIESVYDAQVQGQAAGLNALSVTEWKDNRDRYRNQGRGTAAAQEAAREFVREELRSQGKTESEIEERMARLAALHEPDMVAGGRISVRKLGSRYINSSIGSQWRTNVGVIQAAVDAIPPSEKPKLRMNVKLITKAF